MQHYHSDLTRANMPTLRSHNKNIYETLGRGPVHPFPARMSPGIALDVIGDGRKPLRVLDSMMGSGTVIAMARSKGHKAIGVDIDPLAVLMSKVWTTTIDVKDLRVKAKQVLSRSRTIYATLPMRDAYPRGATHQTRKFISYWFDGYARRQLASLSISISRVQDRTIRDSLWCAFSRLIITKKSGASLAMDLSHSRPHKSFTRAPSKPFTKFLRAVDRVADNCIDKHASGVGPSSLVKVGDARNLSLPDSSIDLVLTSPPYLNAIDYMRCSKFSLVWMGYNLTDLRKSSSRTVSVKRLSPGEQVRRHVENILTDLKLTSKLSKKDQTLLWRYIDDMRLVISEAARVLVPGGRAVYVVGENTIHGTYIRNSAIISAIATQCGLRLKERRIRTIPAGRRYLPAPKARGSSVLDNRIRREVILTFVKPLRIRGTSSRSPRGNAA